jgi:hypothetical protein
MDITDTFAPETEANPTPNPAIIYDGPTPSGKGLKDLISELGLPSDVSTLIDEVQEAILGIVADLSQGQTIADDGKQRSLANIIGSGNRLRGIGTLLISVSLLACIVDFFVGDSIKT